MADNKYFDSKDRRLEMNVAEWVEFVFDKSYLWPEPSGTSNDYQYQGKTIKGGPYWSFKLKAGGEEFIWNVKKKDLAEALNYILANKGGDRRMAVMKFPGVGDDKKHYFCVSDADGTYMRVVPDKELPERFIKFVGVSPNGGAAVNQGPAKPSVAAPPIPLNKIMGECLEEAYGVWANTLKKIWDTRLPSNEPDAEWSDAAYLAFQQAMANGLAQTAHTLFLTKNKNGY